MLNVRIEGYHALEILHYQAGTLNDLLSQIPHDVALQDARAAAHIAKRGPAWRLWDAICDIEPRPESNGIGPVAAGKLLARKRPCLLPVYDSRINKILNRPAQTTSGGRTCTTSSSTTRASSKSLTQFATGQARGTCPCSASST